MSQFTDNITDVLIVGAGPTGLMMACQLAIHMIPFRIIEKKKSPSGNSGALILQARSLEIFEQMGIAQKALMQGIVANKVNAFFNGLNKASIDIKDIGGNLSMFPFLLMLEQSKTEQLLLKFIHEKGYSVERGISFKSFSQDDTGVSSVLIFPDKSIHTIKSKYLIAADGAKSTVRNFQNIPFNGKTFPKPIFVIDCIAKTELSPDEIGFAFTSTSVTGFFPLSRFRWRIDGTMPKEKGNLKTITFDSVKKIFPALTKINFKFHGYGWFSVAHSHQKYARSLRDRNCFLAGDAAHLNTPVGAQGMNTGLQDAYNLGWKLAFVIKSMAKPDLLDSYQAERLGISKGFARYADKVFKIVTSDNKVTRLFRLYVLKLLLKGLFRFSEKKKSLRRMFFVSISQIGIHYRKSILSAVEVKGKYFRGAPKPGDRLPYVEFLNNGSKTNIYNLLNPVCFNLIVLAHDLPLEIEKIAIKNNLAIVLIRYLPETKNLYKILGTKGTGYYLIRPDVHIALRSDTLYTSRLSSYLQSFLIMDQQL